MTSGLRRANVATGELAMREVYCVVVLIAKAVSEVSKKNDFCNKMKKNCIFFQKYLVMSKKSSTFAPAFEKEVRHTVTVLSSSGLGQRPLTP